MTSVKNDIIYLKNSLSLKEGDIIYVVSHKNKRTILTGLLDIITGGAVDLFSSFKGGSLRYLVATSEQGIIYEITVDRKIQKVAEIPSWSSAKKGNFNSETINNQYYKKLRKVLVD